MITNLATPVANGGQTQTYTGTHGVIANPLPAECRCVRVVCTTAAFVEIGPAPVATTASTYVSAGVPEYFACGPNAKVSAIQLTTGGSVYVMPCF